MLRYCILLALSFSLLACSSVHSDNPGLQHLLVARYGHAAAADSARIYVFGGMTGHGISGDIEIIDPRSGARQLLPEHTLPRRYHRAVWDGGHLIYLIGGQSVQQTNADSPLPVEVFNTQTQQVTQQHWLPLNLKRPGVTRLGQQLFVAGGSYLQDDKLYLLDHVTLYRLDANERRRTYALPDSRETQLVSDRRRLYAVSGNDYETPLQDLLMLDLGNAAAGWQTLTPPPHPLSAGSAVLRQQAIYVFGDFSQLDSVLRYDIQHDQWQSLALPFVGRYDSAAVLLNGVIYVIGGSRDYAGTPLDLIEAFD